MSDTITGGLSQILSGEDWNATQYLPGPAVADLGADDDPKKKKPAAATIPATDRLLTGDEWSAAARKSGPEVKQWQIPRLPTLPNAPTMAPRDVTRTPSDVGTPGTPLAPFDIHDPSTYANPILRHVVNPALEHPLETGAILGAGYVAAPVLPVATAVAFFGQPLVDVARYGYQKYLESDLSPDARAEFERDPERVTGEAASVQAMFLGLAPLIHVGVKGAGRLRGSLDYGAGMTEAGAKGVADLNLGPRFSDGFSDRVANERFARGLEDGAASARIPNDVARPAGLVTSQGAQPPARTPRPVEGLVVPENVKAGKVTPVETTDAAAPLDERAALDESVRTYQAQRAEQDARDLSDARSAEAERVARVAGGIRRRPGGVANPDESRPFFESEHGAEVLGSMAARHGLPNDASPYIPESPLDAAWKAGHGSATESSTASSAATPSYPEGFSMGGALDEGRIPPASEVPKTGRGSDARPAGFEPTALPEGVTPESAALAASLKPSRYRAHSTDALIEAALDGRTRLEEAQAAELYHSEGQIGTQEWMDRVDNNQETEPYYAKTRAVETERAKNALAQIEREIALRGLHGDALAEKIAAAQETRLERQAMQEEESLAYVTGDGPRGAAPTFDPFGDESAPAQPGGPAVHRFTTEKGSQYEVQEDGTTTRNKAARPEHPGEAGPQPRSQLTVYVDDAGLRALGEIQAQGGGKRILARLSDGRIGVKYLDGPSAGKFEARTVVTPHTEPAVGLYPVETWEGGRSHHFGNKIVAVEGAPRGPASGSPGSPPVEGTGETRTRGLASAIERKAIANKIAETLGPDLPTYHRTSMAEQADLATALLARDPSLARAVALGHAPAPEGLLPESVLVAVERKAVAEGDVATLRDLATGQLGEQITHMGQRIRALAERDPDSPVGAIQQVVDARTDAGAKVPRATEAVVADLRAKLTASLSPEELAKFIDSLRC